MRLHPPPTRRRGYPNGAAGSDRTTLHAAPPTPLQRLPQHAAKQRRLISGDEVENCCETETPRSPPVRSERLKLIYGNRFSNLKATVAPPRIDRVTDSPVDSPVTHQSVPPPPPQTAFFAWPRGSSGAPTMAFRRTDRKSSRAGLFWHRAPIRYLKIGRRRSPSPHHNFLPPPPPTPAPPAGSFAIKRDLR